MFWKKAAPARGTDVAPAPPPAGDSEDQALDALVSVVKSFGKDAFDTDKSSAETTRAECDDWAQRITIGPGRPDDGDAEEQGFRRDWGGLRRYFSAHRAHERDYVTRSFSTMREAVQTFARCLTDSVGEERASDERLGHELGQLLDSFRGNDPTTIRRGAESVARAVQEAIERRREREAKQVALLGEKIQALREELQQARELAALDPLTHLYNRNTLDTHLERVADLAYLLSSSPCLLMIDVDHFKSVNDKHGHLVGDEVLKRVADALVRQFLRREDFVARYGGEEFVIVIPDSTLENARRRSERVREAVESLAFERPAGLKVTISVGISCLASGDDGKSWLARADAALYEAKAAGRNAVRVSPFPAHSVASLRPSLA